MKNPNNRFSKIAGLFDSPIIAPQKSTMEKNDKPLKKWDETTTRRFIAIQEIRKEIKYFAADFENWARDQFGSDAPESDYATKLSKKLNKAEAVLYAITSQMSDLAKTGEIPAEFVKLASEEDSELLTEAWETKADDKQDNDVEYSLEYEVKEDGWEAKISASGFNSIDIAESDIEAKIQPLIEAMKLVCEDETCEPEEETEEEHTADQKEDHDMPLSKEAQRTIDEGSPRGTWVDVTVNANEKELSKLENMFTDEGLFTQILNEETLRIRNSSNNISQKIVDMLKREKVKFNFVDPYSGETHNG